MKSRVLATYISLAGTLFLVPSHCFQIPVPHNALETGHRRNVQRTSSEDVNRRRLPNPLGLPKKRITPKPKPPPSSDEMSSEFRLYNRLLSPTRYQKYVRPVKNHNLPTSVKLGMCVMMIEEIVERDQILSMAVCIKMKWTDHYLRWNPEEIGNLTWMAVPSSNIWLPDIAIINSPEPYQLTRQSTNVELKYNGEIGFYPSGKLVTRCNIQIKYFPLDWQRCEIRLESWIYSTDHLRIEVFDSDPIDIKEYYSNHEWAVVGYEVIPELAAYDGKNFSTITFAFVFRRKPIYYFTYFIFPQLMLALMQTLSSTLPVEHPGRMAMLTSLFIGTSVTQAGVTDLIPKSSDSMSLLQIYMSIMSCNIVIALIVTCVMMYSVLRYPNEEPSLTAIFVAFFSIVWPHRSDHQGTTSLTEKILASRTATPSIKSASNSSNHLSIDVKLSPPAAPDSGCREVNDTPPSNDEDSPNRNEAEYAEVDSLRTVLISPQHEAVRREDSTTSAAAKRLMFARKVSQSEGGVQSSKCITKKLSLPASNSDSPQRERLHKQITIDSASTAPCFTVPQLLVSLSEDTPEDIRNRRSRLGMGRPQRLPVCEEIYETPPSRRLMLPKQQSFYDSTTDMMANGFLTMNPNVESDRGNNNYQQSTSDDTCRDANSLANRKKKLMRRRGEASASDETRELKRKWLLYCVALDKTFMYGNLTWNIIVPIVLFVIIPLLMPRPSIMGVTAMEEEG